MPRHPSTRIPGHPQASTDDAPIRTPKRPRRPPSRTTAPRLATASHHPPLLTRPRPPSTASHTGLIRTHYDLALSTATEPQHSQPPCPAPPPAPHPPPSTTPRSVPAHRVPSQSLREVRQSFRLQAVLTSSTHHLPPLHPNAPVPSHPQGRHQRPTRLATSPPLAPSQPRTRPPSTASHAKSSVLITCPHYPRTRHLSPHSPHAWRRRQHRRHRSR